jgi:signal peptidase
MAALTWVPKVTHVRTDIIVGQSMEPTIPLYSVIVVETVKPEAIRVGDVISFQEPDQPERKVTHRVASIEKGKNGHPSFITKGDNNDARDPWRVDYERDAYRVTTHVPAVGWLMIKAQTRWARLVLVVAPVLLMLVQFLRWTWSDDDEDDDADDHSSTADDDGHEEYDWRDDPLVGAA